LFGKALVSLAFEMTEATPVVVTSASWRVRDAADSLLTRRGLRSTSLLEGKIDPDEDDYSIPEMTISKYFDVDTCQARLRRDKTPIVKMALDAAASAILENLHKADDDEGESERTTSAFESNNSKRMLPSLLEDIEKLQEMRVESMERAHANKDLGKRRIAVAKEQEKERKLQNKKEGRSSQKAGKVASDNANSNTLSASSQTKAKVADGSKVAASGSKDATIKSEPGANSSKSTLGSTTKKTPKTPAAPPKFTRNTPASSASALEARLTGSRAILCTAANVAFDSLTPALPEWEAIDVADVPQNPATNKRIIETKSEGENFATSESGKIEDNDDDEGNKSATVPNMGPVIIEAQTLGKRIENVATNAVRRSKRRFRFRKDNIRFGNKSCTGSGQKKGTEGFRILENPFAWKDSDDEDMEDSGESCPMDVDESATIVTADSSSGMDSSEISETWGKVCIPRLLSILQTGVGNAILHDVMWSTRHCRIANLLHEISLMTEDSGNSIIDKLDSTCDRNYGPHLIVTVEPDVDKFAREFKAPNSHLRLMSTVDESSLRALAYKGTKNERRKLRKQFPQATGLQDASFHVIVVSYADFLTDYIHFCQTPFEVVILDDGVSWMGAAHNDPNSPIATVWEDALFSKNDHQLGLAGTVLKDWDYSADTFDDETLKDVWIGLTARHRLVTSSKLRVENPRSPADLLPVPGLLNFAMPHFSDAVKEEWDRSRISNDAFSMSHFRRLLTRSMVVHDPNGSDIIVKTEEGETTPAKSNSIYDLAMSALLGEMSESIRSKNFPPVPKEISDDSFISDGKVASSRRSALQWLGSLEDSWLRYELGSVSFQHILVAMKTSLNYGHICEEITTASSIATGATGQIIGNLAFKLGVRSGKSFSSEQGLRQHLSTHHAPPGTWLCRTCKVDCITSQARTHHERSCGQPSSAGGLGNAASASSAPGSKKDAGKKKGKASKSGGSGSAGAKEEKDPDGSVRVPSYRGVWVDQAGKYFIKIESERVCENDKNKPLTFESIEEAAKKYDAVLKSKDKGNETKIEYNFKSDGTRVVYEDVSTSTTTGLGGGVVPALSVINIKDLPPDVKPLLRDPRQTSRTGGNSKRHVYAYRGVCRQARKGHDRWQSQISFLGVNHYLGTFDSEWDAAAIYAWAHLILYGEEATRKAQKEGEEAAAAYEQEKKDIAAGKIPAAPPKPEKKPKQGKKKMDDKSTCDAKKGKKGVKKEDKSLKRKPGRPPKKKADEAFAKQPQGKRSKTAGGKEELFPVISQSIARATILAPVPKFIEMNDDELMREAATRMVAARSVNYCVTEVSLPAPIHMDFRPCVPLREELEDQVGGGALLVGINPSLFGWSIESIVSKQYFGSDSERRNATEALTEEFGEDGLNQHFQSLVQGSTTVIGCASSRMKRVYSSLGMGSPPMGGPIGPIDCNTGGNSKCCSETAACIRHVPTENGNFQLSALSSDLITMNGQRITPEMGSFPLLNEDICTIGSRVFIFLLPPVDP